MRRTYDSYTFYLPIIKVGGEPVSEKALGEIIEEITMNTQSTFNHTGLAFQVRENANEQPEFAMSPYHKSNAAVSPYKRVEIDAWLDARMPVWEQTLGPGVVVQAVEVQAWTTT